MKTNSTNSLKVLRADLSVDGEIKSYSYPDKLEMALRLLYTATPSSLWA